MESLRKLLNKRMRIGTCIRSSLLNEASYTSLIKKEFSIITPESDNYINVICPKEGEYNFKDSDKVIDFALKNNIKARGHILLWHLLLPDWLDKKKFTKEELKRFMKEYITRVLKHFKGKVFEWLVVNEAVADNSSLRKSKWLDIIGPEYISLAFKYAHEADPKAKLYYNDYSIEEVNDKSNKVYEIIKKLIKEKTPVHGLGLQMHLLEEVRLDYKSIDKNIKRFKRLGLDISITELDVRIKKPITKKKLEHQAQIYGDIMRLALKNNIKTFIMWGFTDKYSWIPEWYPKYDSALIFDKELQQKPAYHKLMDVIKELVK